MLSFCTITLFLYDVPAENLLNEHSMTINTCVEEKQVCEIHGVVLLTAFIHGRPDDPVEYLAAYLMKHNPKNKK
jgi:hypothetical protein